MDFYEVDLGAARVLCSLANIDKVPVVHLYQEGTLTDTRMVHTRALFQDFASSLATEMKVLLADDLFAWTPPPGFEEGPTFFCEERCIEVG